MPTTEPAGGEQSSIAILCSCSEDKALGHYLNRHSYRQSDRHFAPYLARPCVTTLAARKHRARSRGPAGTPEGTRVQAGLLNQAVLPVALTEVVPGCVPGCR